MTQKLLDFCLEHQGQIKQPHPVRAWPTQEAYELLKKADPGVKKDLKYLCMGNKIHMIDMLDHFMRLPELREKDNFDKRRRREEKKKIESQTRRKKQKILKVTTVQQKISAMFSGKEQNLEEALANNPEYQCLLQSTGEEVATKENISFNRGIYAIYLLAKHYDNTKSDNKIFTRILGILNNLHIKSTRGKEYSGRSSIRKIADIAKSGSVLI